MEEMEEIVIDSGKGVRDEQLGESGKNGYGGGLVDGREAMRGLRDGIGKIAGEVRKEGEDREAG
uniref:hypothetical protein n=1 Tax=Bacillus sp. WP8 TaxID=756828 RepID=UPI001C930A27